MPPHRCRKPDLQLGVQFLNKGIWQMPRATEAVSFECINECSERYKSVTGPILKEDPASIFVGRAPSSDFWILMKSVILAGLKPIQTMMAL